MDTAQDSVAETKVAIQEQFEIDLVNNNEKEIEELEYKDYKNIQENDNYDNQIKDNTYVLMAYNQARPGGVTFGNTSQTRDQILPAGDTQSFRTMQQVPPIRNHFDNQDPSPIYEEVVIICDPGMRNRFIKYIMSLVFIMLVLTASFIAFVLTVPVVKEWFRYNAIYLILPILIMILTVNCAFTWNLNYAQKPPWSFILLFMSVVGMSLLSAMVTSFFSTEVVLYAFIATTTVVFICIILACTDFDFTSYLLYFIGIGTAIGMLAIIILTILALSRSSLEPTFLVFLIAATLVQVLMLIICLQMIIGGKFAEISERDFIVGAYFLYMSIIDMFLKMVCLIGVARDL